MQITQVDGPIYGRSRARLGLGAVVDQIGEEAFDPAFMQFIASLCSAEHFAMYAVADDTCRVIGSSGAGGGSVAKNQACLYSSNAYWRVDPALRSLWSSDPDCRPVLAHMEIGEIAHDEMREKVYGPHGVRERVVISSRSRKQTTIVSLINTHKRGAFSNDHLSALERMADNIIAMAAKHAEMRMGPHDASSALTSLPAIEACVSICTPRLARREAEVCARILYGMTSLGIALDLGIGEESAMTYRKRAYSRLGIGSQRELLLWYLNQWAKQNTASYTGLQ